jgi:hypothetical protein
MELLPNKFSICTFRRAMLALTLHDSCKWVWNNAHNSFQPVVPKKDNSNTIKR